MAFVTDNLLVDGVRLAYRDRGRGEPVVFLHGTPSYSYEWRQVVPRVEDAGHRTIVYDLLGYGASERPARRDTSVPAQAALLDRLLAELGVDRVTLIGHDIGGAIAQRFALAHPERVRRLMLLDTVSYDSWPSSTWQQIIAEHPDEHRNLTQDALNALLTRQLRMTVADEATMSAAVLAAYLAPHQSGLGPVSFFEHQVRHYDSKHTEEISAELGTLTMPVRILWGEQDRWQPLHYAHRLLADIPTADLVTIPDAGHFLTEDAPDRVAHEINEFLATPPRTPQDHP
jgi:pimeloyl-ACP methyl ester carboxylesterase